MLPESTLKVTHGSPATSYGLTSNNALSEDSMLDAGQVHCIIRVQIKERIKNNKGWTTGLRVIL